MYADQSLIQKKLISACTVETVLFLNVCTNVLAKVILKIQILPLDETDAVQVLL